MRSGIRFTHHDITLSLSWEDKRDSSGFWLHLTLAGGGDNMSPTVYDPRQMNANESNKQIETLQKMRKVTEIHAVTHDLNREK